MSKRWFSVVSIFLAMVITATLLCSCGDSKIVLNNDKLTITVGDTYQLTISNQDGKVTWSSSNEKVATVDQGKVTGVSKGEAEVYAVVSDGTKLTCKVTVENIEITSIKLDKTNIMLREGDSAQIDAKLNPSNAVDELEWESSDTSVAIVDNNGFVTAVSKGTAAISCSSSNGKSASCSVKVKEQYSISGKNSSSSSASNDTDNNNNPPKTDDIGSSCYYCTLCENFVTLREQPSKSSKEITKVVKGEAVNFISYVPDSEFMYVSYKGNKGYVMSVYFTPSKENNGRAVMYCRARQFANLRSVPGSNNKYNILRIPKDAVVQSLGKTMLENNQSYIQVTYKNTTGYVLSAVFSLDPNAPLYKGN